jgi:O-acetyl-ADP-ribose deacetylase (regulator of RNase III)
MGKGIALEYKLRYPHMFKRYKNLCNRGLLDVGKLWIYKAEDKWILNFPTKKHWRDPSELEYLELGLQKFVDTYKAKGITSIAFPLLGANNGGIPPKTSLEIMKRYLDQCEIPVYIFDDRI